MQEKRIDNLTRPTKFQTGHEENCKKHHTTKEAAKDTYDVHSINTSTQYEIVPHYEKQRNGKSLCQQSTLRQQSVFESEAIKIFQKHQNSKFITVSIKCYLR